MKKLFLLSIMCFMAIAMNAQVFVDLGLTSGTKWKAENQSGFYSYDEAITRFGNRLPTKEQWEELEDECSWKWTGSEYKVTGPNGKSITLSVDGERLCDVSMNGAGTYGCYWSLTSINSDNAWGHYIDSSHVLMYVLGRCVGCSVRLVQN